MAQKFLKRPFHFAALGELSKPILEPVDILEIAVLLPIISASDDKAFTASAFILGDLVGGFQTVRMVFVNQIQMVLLVLFILDHFELNLSLSNHINPIIELREKLLRAFGVDLRIPTL
jgi:hypothetical protein